MVDHAFHYSSGEGAPLPETIGRFRVLGKAGGSQASVFRASDPVSGMDVALKALGNRYDSYAHSLFAALIGDVDMEEIRREAELLAVLRHPNIVSVIDVGEDASLGPYLVMEWVPGGDLRIRLNGADNRQLPIQEALRIARDVLAGLTAAHEAGVVHRDVKPDNILLSNDGTAKLADFGIAGDGAIAALQPGRGTRGYMAPEQEDDLRSDSADHAVDIYAVGVVLFEMLAGRLPDEGEDIRLARSGVTEAIAAVVERATQPDPTSRFPSAAEMAAALSDVG